MLVEVVLEVMEIEHQVDLVEVVLVVKLDHLLHRVEHHQLEIMELLTLEVEVVDHHLLVCLVVMVVLELSLLHIQLLKSVSYTHLTLPTILLV